MKQSARDTVSAILGSSFRDGPAEESGEPPGEGPEEESSDGEALDAIADDLMSGDRASVRSALAAFLELARR